MTQGSNSATVPSRAARTVVSFGYLHGAAPTGDLTLDARRWLRDPARAREILDLDGRDARVQQVVCSTDGAVAAIRHIVGFMSDFPAERDCTVCIGCAGGRHRSVALAMLVAGALMMRGLEVAVEHRDVHRPRVLAAGPGARNGG